MSPQQQITPGMIKSGEPKVCAGCGSDLFLRPLNILSVSRLSPDNKTGQDVTINLPSKIAICVKCGAMGTDVVKSKYIPAVKPDKVS